MNAQIGRKQHERKEVAVGTSQVADAVIEKLKQTNR